MAGRSDRTVAAEILGRRHQDEASTGYRLHHETEDAYHVEQPDGSIAQVPKDGTPKRILAAMAHLPRVATTKMADGGEAPTYETTPLGPDYSVPVPGEPQPGPAIDPRSSLGPFLTAAGTPEAEQLAAEAPPAAASPAAVPSPPGNLVELPGHGGGPPAPPPAAPGGAAMPGGASLSFPALPGYPSAGLERGVRSMVQTGREGAQLQAEAQAQQAADLTKVYQEHQAGLDDIKGRWQAEHTGVMGEYASAVNDVRNSRVDPSRFWSTRTGGQKVSAVIGMILGGIGSGLTGQPNAALAVIDRAIDRDIEAQKAEMGQKNNLVSMLYQKLGTVDAAANMARMYLSADVAAKVGLAGARAGTTQARATAKLLESHLQEQALGPMAQIINGKYQADIARYNMTWNQRLMQWTMNQSGSGPGGQTYLPSLASPPMGKEMMDVPGMLKDRSERSVIGPGGRQFIAYTADAAKGAREKLAAQDELEGTINQLDRIRQQVKSKIMPTTTAANLYDKYRSALTFNYMNAHGLKRLSEEDIKKIDAVAPDKLDSFLRGAAGFEPLRRAVYENRTSTWKYAGLDPRVIPPFETPIPGVSGAR